MTTLGAMAQPITFPLRLRAFLRAPRSLHGVRSYEKFTGEGVSFPIEDLTEILEIRLPAEFGGGPYDYQLIEEEGPGAQTRLTLRIHPEVGPVDGARVLARLIEELGRADHRHRFMTGLWRQAGTFRVERRPPRTSLRGKTLAVHLAMGTGPVAPHDTVRLAGPDHGTSTPGPSIPGPP